MKLQELFESHTVGDKIKYKKNGETRYETQTGAYVYHSDLNETNDIDYNHTYRIGEIIKGTEYGDVKVIEVTPKYITTEIIKSESVGIYNKGYIDHETERAPVGDIVQFELSPEEADAPCKTCGGTGKVNWDHHDEFTGDHEPAEAPCPDCDTVKEASTTKIAGGLDPSAYKKVIKHLQDREIAGSKKATALKNRVMSMWNQGGVSRKMVSRLLKGLDV